MILHHMTRVAIVFAAAILLSCSGDRDPFSVEAVTRDLEARTVAQLYEEAEGKSYTPPAHGRISREQLAGYLRVTRLADTIVEIASRRFSDQADEAANETDRFDRMATTFSAFGSARAAGTAELRAALTLGVNPHEFAWVDARVSRAMRILKERAKLEKAVHDAAGDGSRQRLAKEEQDEWKRSVADADATNAKLVEPHRNALATRHRL